MKKLIPLFVSSIIITLLIVLVACKASSPETLPSKSPPTQSVETITPNPNHTPTAYLELPPETLVTTFADECSEASTQMEMNACAQRRLETSKQQLENLISDLWDHMEAEQHKKLLFIQAQWKEGIEQYCQWEATFSENGSVSPMLYANCMSRQYQLRIADLSIHLCEGHGLTGECDEALQYTQ